MTYCDRNVQTEDMPPMVVGDGIVGPAIRHLPQPIFGWVSCGADEPICDTNLEAGIKLVDAAHNLANKLVVPGRSTKCF